MSENALGPSNVVHLVPTPKPLKLELSLICQNAQDREKKKPTVSSQNQKSLDKILSCQGLIKVETFSLDDEIDFSRKRMNLLNNIDC